MSRYRCKAGHLSKVAGCSEDLEGNRTYLCAVVVDHPCDMGVFVDGKEVGRYTSWRGWCMEECEQVPEVVG